LRDLSRNFCRRERRSSRLPSLVTIFGRARLCRAANVDQRKATARRSLALPTIPSRRARCASRY
jgi:hypothetical protein